MLIMLVSTIPSFAVNPTEEPGTVAIDVLSLYSTEMPSSEMITAEQILAYKPKELAEKYDVDLNFKQRVALNLVRKKLKKAERKGEDVDAALNEMVQEGGGGGWHWGGFFLGLFLGLIGWLIAILVWPKQGAGKAAIVGMLILIAVVVLITVL